MTELTEASLAKALEEMQKMIEQRNEPITLKPTKMIFRPADLTRLGLTVDDVKKMIRDNQ
jgi:hypothetical protein